MGFRSTFAVEDFGIVWPQWFRDKWGRSCFFKEDGSGVFAPMAEGKTYGSFSDLPEDIQKAIDWRHADESFVLVFLHECGGITRVQISQRHILFSEPTGWRNTDGVTHSYCYGCSDVITPTDQQSTLPTSGEK